MREWAGILFFGTLVLDTAFLLIEATRPETQRTIAASRTRLWLASGWGCRSRRPSRGQNSPDTPPGSWPHRRQGRIRGRYQDEQASWWGLMGKCFEGRALSEIPGRLRCPCHFLDTRSLERRAHENSLCHTGWLRREVARPLRRRSDATLRGLRW